MKRIVVLCLALFPAAAWSAGVDLSWNDCVPAGANQKTFTCTGLVNETYRLELQYKSPVALANFVSLTSYVRIVVVGAQAGQPLAPFWHYEPGGCNGGTAFYGVGGGVALSPMPAPAAVECANLAQTWDLNDDGIAEGYHSIAAYGADFQAPGHGYFILLSARDVATTIDAGVNYWGHELRFNNKNRQDCAGCSQDVAIVYTLARLESNDGAPAVDLFGTDKVADCALINGALPGDCDYVVPVRNMTWGTLKSLFR